MPSMIAALRRAFDLHARRPALEGAHWQLDYRDLADDSAALAAELARRGVRPGDIVPMALARSPAAVVAAVAVVRCGAAYAPLDLANPPERLAAMLARLDGPLVLVDPGVELPPGQAGRALELPALMARLAPPPAVAPWPAEDEDAIACVMFTSGSTGTPKAVQVPRRGIARLVLETDYAEFRPDARWAHMASPAFDASLLEVWAPLLNGGCCVVQERALPGLHELAAFLVDRRVTDAWLTAALFNAMVDDQPDAFGGLRQLLTGGEVVSVAHARACLARWPALVLIDGYGPTENTTFSLAHRVGPADLAGASIPIGRPIRGTQLRIEPLGDAAAATAGLEHGELWLAGAGLSPGYLGDPEQTARRFVAAPDGTRWYRTGDRVTRRADGVVLFEGRIDREIKLRGHRVELDQLEQLLAAAPGVTDAAVLVAGDTADTRHLVACIGGSGRAPAVDAVRDWLAARVAPAAVPERWLARPRLPRNANGKIDRAALRQAAEAAPGAPGAAHEPPATPTEAALLALWAAQLPGASLHRGADYLASGGHSLGALRLAAEIGRTLGKHVEALALLRASRLDAQARLVDAAPPAAADAVPAARGARVAWTDEQLVALQADALDADGTAYLVHRAWRVAPGLARPRLRAAFEALSARHPSLRLAWRRGEVPPHARRLDGPPPGLVRHHGALAAPPSPEAWPADVLARVAGDFAVGDQGPMRVDTWDLPGGALLVVLTLHHAVIDAWSLERIRLEVDAWLRGETALLAAVAPAELAPVDEAGLRRQAARLAHDAGPPAPVLPRAPGPGGALPLALAPALGEALHALARRAGVAPLAPLLVAWSLALQRVFGPARHPVATPFARRLGPDADRAIGYHLDLRLLEAAPAPGESMGATLRRVDDELLAAHRPLRRPLARLLEAVAELDAARRAGLGQFCLTWQPGRETAFTWDGVAVDEIELPQRGARFALALHVETTQAAPTVLVARIEALQALVDDGRAAAAGFAFAQALRTLCEAVDVEVAARHAAPAAAAPAPPVDAALVEAAASAWTQALGRPPAGADDDFLRAGGSSLRATALAAALRRALGRDLDLAAFLRAPRFGVLCASLAQAPAAQVPAVLRLGASNARRRVLLIPGGAGGPLGLYTLATALRGRLPADCAIAIADLGALMHDAPEPPTGDWFAARLLQLARDLDARRLAGIAGFSLGGLFALDVAAALAPAAPPVVLLDTCAPQGMRLDAAARLRRAVVGGLRDPAGTWRRLRARGAPPEPGSVEADPQYPRWQRLMDEMARRPVPAGLRATLVRSPAGAAESGLLRHLATNGFDPRGFAALHRVPLPYPHLALLREGVHETAAAIARALQDPRP